MTQKTRSWWALIGFCTTTAIVAAFSLAILAASASVAFAVGQSVRSGKLAQASGGQQTFSGVITDSQCGARHQDASKSPAECAQKCAGNGAGYVLVDGDKVLTLAGNKAAIAEHAGQRVSVAGTLDGDKVQVASIRSQQ
jgi:hypothetical protein